MSTRTSDERVRDAVPFAVRVAGAWSWPLIGFVIIAIGALALRDQGCALLVVSEELDELFEVCDRLVVIAQGQVSPSVKTAEATTLMIGEWMSGLWPRAGDTPASEAVHAEA